MMEEGQKKGLELSRTGQNGNGLNILSSDKSFLCKTLQKVLTFPKFLSKY